MQLNYHTTSTNTNSESREAGMQNYAKEIKYVYNKFINSTDIKWVPRGYSMSALQIKQTWFLNINWK